MIAVNKLSVGSLSAISANIGSVTAGNISGVTINAGDATLNSSGLRIGDTSITSVMSGAIAVHGSLFVDNDVTIQGALGASGSCSFDDGKLAVGGDGVVSNADFTAVNSMRWEGYDTQNAGIGRPLVVSTDGVIHRATNGISGTYSGFSFENGICTGHP